MTTAIVQTGDPVLRTPAAPLTKEEISSSFIQDLIAEMRDTMRAAPGVGLAAPQIGHSLQLVVIEDPADAKTRLSEAQLAKRGRTHVPFHVLINPRLIPDESKSVEFFEGCLSVAGFAALTPRFLSVKVEALNEHGEPISIDATGWYARILQHEIDHLNGILYIDRMVSESFSTVENLQHFAET